MPVCHWFAERGRLEAAVHIQTHVGIRVMTDRIRDRCGELGYKPYAIEPQPKFVYAAFVLQYGFPGPPAHRMIMGLLRYKTMRDFAPTPDPKRHCPISGARKFEPDRRRANCPHPIQHDGRIWFCCPFFHMTAEVYRYVHTKGVKITHVHKKTGMSGERMRGSYATRGQKEMVGRWIRRWQNTSNGNESKWLEEGVRKFGSKQAKQYPARGGTAGMGDLGQQRVLDAFFEARPDLRNVTAMEAGICGS